MVLEARLYYVLRDCTQQPLITVIISNCIIEPCIYNVTLSIRFG